MLTETACAKINLFLHITGKRPDGYHELESVVTFTRGGDVLHAEEARLLSFGVSGPFAGGLPADEGNLVMRAAQALQEAAGVKKGARLKLEKNLPVASGIGGGSADAAAALRLLSRLWKLDTPLEKVARVLGSDVAACLSQHSAWMSGVGDILAPAALPPLFLLLVNPGVSVLTKDVYARVSPPYRKAVARPARVDMAWLAAQHNDLETYVPEAAEALRWLNKQPGCELARMSGSGATCFGIFKDMPSLRAARAKCEWWSYADEAQ